MSKSVLASWTLIFLTRDFAQCLAMFLLHPHPNSTPNQDTSNKSCNNKKIQAKNKSPSPTPCSISYTPCTLDQQGANKECMKLEIQLGGACFHPIVTPHYYKIWVQFISPCSLDHWIHYFFRGGACFHPIVTPHYYKMWVQFISPCSLDHWIHYFSRGGACFHPIVILQNVSAVH
jgi:hypothetical protein